MFKKLLLFISAVLIVILIYIGRRLFFNKDTVEIPGRQVRNTNAPLENRVAHYVPAAQRQPMTRLLLINFENDPDEIYYGFELMYLDSDETGSGYRVIGYRHDGYSDYYDEESLIVDPDANLSVTGQGVKHHIQLDLGSPQLTMDDKGVQANFSFKDYQGRDIDFSLVDNSSTSSKKTDLLAPVGASSNEPKAFPLIYLYDFDFIPKKDSQYQLTIDNKEHHIDDFPVPLPLNGKTRTFMRYSFDVDAIDLFPSGVAIKEVTLDDDLTYQDELATYYYTYEDEQIKLAEIIIDIEKPVTIRFAPAISNQTGQGDIVVLAQDEMGPLVGHYEVNGSNEEGTISIQFDKGWLAQTSGFIASMVLTGERSLFRNWPKDYEYEAQFNISNHKFNSEWVNHNQKE